MKFEEYRSNAFLAFHELEEVPDDFIKFTSEDVAPEYLFYNVKEKSIYCSFCRQEASIKMLPKRKHKANGICPMCNKNIIMIALGYGHNIHDEYCSLYIQPYKGNVILRYFKVIQNFTRDYKNPTCKIYELYRTLFEGEEEITYNKERGVWIQSYRPNDLYLEETKIYTKNLDTVFKGTPFEHCMFDTFIEKHEYNHPWQFERYLKKYLSSPIMEYLYKLKWFNIAELHFNNHFSYVQSFETDTTKYKIHEMLKLKKYQFRELLVKETEPTAGTISLYQKANKYNLTVDEYQLWRKHITEWNFTHWKELASKYMNVNQLNKYLDEHIDNEKKYFDYLSMAEELEYNMKSNFVLFPRDIKQAHDVCIELINIKKEKEKIEEAKELTDYQQYINAYKRRYAFSDKKYSIIIPKDCCEIVKEGQKLHHCVGTYVNRVNNGETVILFLRENSDKNKSFYTMEIRDGKVVQCRGLRNCTRTEEVNNFLQKFTKRKKLMYSC